MGDSAKILAASDIASYDAFIEYVSTLTDGAVPIHTELCSPTVLHPSGNPAP